MGSWFFDKTFQDGVEAGDELLDLIIEIDPRLTFACQEMVPRKTVDEICTALFSSVGAKPKDYVRGFLSRILRPTTLDGQIVTLFGADEILAEQTNCAPIAEISKGEGLIGLGYWTGRGDGDGWCLDLKRDQILCLSVESGCEPVENVRLASYAIVHTFRQWVAYLRCSAWERGWLRDPAPASTRIASSDSSFQAGFEAGKSLMELICEVDPDLQAACEETVPPEKSEEILFAIRARSPDGKSIPCVEGFLTRVLRPSELRCGEPGARIIGLYGIDDILFIQGDFAPISYAPPDSGFTQLADWSGESDADGWWLDTEYDCIRCVYVGNGSEIPDECRLASYGVFHSLWQWISHLECVAEERGYL